VLAEAVRNIARHIDLTNQQLGGILMMSDQEIGEIRFEEPSTVFTKVDPERAVLFVRMYFSLDALTGGNDVVARAWLRSQNTDLGSSPLDKMQTKDGLAMVCSYVHSHTGVW